MRKKIIAGNWKMNNDLSGTKNLINGLNDLLKNENINCDVIVCPPFTNLSEANTLLKDSKMQLGAQNMYFEDSGAFTGEISAQMLLSVGCKYVILGHSERRAIFMESDDVINKKIKKALSAGLLPIFCIGETLEEREGGITNNIIEGQLKNGLTGISEEELGKIIVAYEPVWAIGTGKTATPQQAQDVHAFIRGWIKKNYSQAAADKLVIQYGGSVKPDNAKELLSQTDIDGALVGGACLKADSFIGIIKGA
ncbi:MAG TPA: triose-phosphate isomerase [Ignavibacteriaceae bacterium]|nr:triose-phosphate isomerase [Ignavibacteriaceae bacterium]